jgi:hypothetical protein
MNENFSHLVKSLSGQLPCGYSPQLRTCLNIKRLHFFLVLVVVLVLETPAKIRGRGRERGRFKGQKSIFRHALSLAALSRPEKNAKLVRLILLWLLVVSLADVSVFAITVQTDICIFGGTAAGVMAAVQTAKMGKTVVVIEPGRHLGGMTSGGLGWTDVGNKAGIGGLARQFYRDLGRHYGKAEAWTFEPHVAEQEFIDLLKQEKVTVYYQQPLAAVKTGQGRILELTTADGTQFHARIFIDASYEGDLMAKAGVKYSLGREANSEYGETLNGIRGKTPKNQFTMPVDPYRVAGQSRSGLLPFIQPSELGTPGDGDRCIQAYNYRLCLTTNAANRLPITAPANYDPQQYELLGRYFDTLAAAGKKPRLRDFIKLDMVTADKTDINNNGGFSTDFIGLNYSYPEADPAARAQFQASCLDYTRGFLTYLATSSRVPAPVRAEMQRWGLCRDEFVDTGGWPSQLYIREARRMKAAYMMTEKNCRGSETVSDSIGMASYNMDSHNCRRIAQNGHVENEGDVQAPSPRPFPVSYRSIVPPDGACGNLLVPVCLGATHIAYGSIRMEPVFMILGQSAATAAVLAIEENETVQSLNYAALESRLTGDGQVLNQPVNGK